MRPEATTPGPGTLRVLCPPAKKGEPLQKEAPGPLHALRVGAPVLQAIVREVPQDVQALRRRDVPVSLLLDLREEPGLEQGATVEGDGQGDPVPPASQSPRHLGLALPASLSQASCCSPGDHDACDTRLHGTVGVLE